MTSGSATPRANVRQEKLDELKRAQVEALRRRRVVAGIWVVGLIAVAVLVTAALLSARPEQSAATRPAPDFTLPVSDGTSVTLSDLRGGPVILYFSEGAGCDTCLVQMAEIEKDPGFADAGITVLPIVMNSADQINSERERLGVTSPFLLDDGTVSEEYGALGTGMHAGLPGHGFVLIDADGVQRWQGDYPSMWLAPADLLDEALSRL
ncbi:peroxiredoxin family protein [Cellulomonas hominis]